MTVHLHDGDFFQTRLFDFQVLQLALLQLFNTAQQNQTHPFLQMNPQYIEVNV